MVTNRQHVWRCAGRSGLRKTKCTGSGQPIHRGLHGAIEHRQRAALGLRVSVHLRAASSGPRPTRPAPAATSFAYSVSHPVTPLPASVIERTINTDGRDSDEADAFDTPHEQRVDVRIGAAARIVTQQHVQRGRVGGARQRSADSVLRQPDLAGEQLRREVDQPRGSAGRRPVHAADRERARADQSVRADPRAARRGEASCAGCRRSSAISGWRRRPTTPVPARVSNWMAKRGGLPGETRNYVIRITGRQAEQWTSSEFVRDPEATLMPAKAPCVEVAEEVEGAGQDRPRRQADVGACRRHQGAAARHFKRRQVRRSGVADREREARVAAARAECGSRAFSRTSASRRPARRRPDPRQGLGAKSARAWSRIADRTMKKAAEEFAKRCRPRRLRSRASAQPPPRVAYSRCRRVTRQRP